MHCRRIQWRNVIVYRILVYLCACLKAGQRPSLEYLQYGTDDFHVVKDCWQYIWLNLYKEGYIDGIKVIPILGEQNKVIKLTDQLAITPKGIEYVAENNAMQKAKNFLKGLKEIVPGM